MNNHDPDIQNSSSTTIFCNVLLKFTRPVASELTALMLLED